MQKTHIFLFGSLLSCFLLLSGFIGVDSIVNTPGLIEFTGDAGSPNIFSFQKWEFEEVALPDGDFEQVQAKVLIYTGSLKTNWKELEKSIQKKKDYFYVKKFPKAQVQIDGAKRLADGSYQTEAILSLKGISKKVLLSFTVSQDRPYNVQGSATIQRSVFNFSGDGPKEEVPVRFEFILPVPQ